MRSDPQAGLLSGLFWPTQRGRPAPARSPGPRTPRPSHRTSSSTGVTGCGARTAARRPRPRMPSESATGYGPRAQAVAAMLTGSCRLGKRGVSQLFDDLFGLLEPAMVCKLQRQTAAALRPIAEEAPRVHPRAPGQRGRDRLEGGRLRVRRIRNATTNVVTATHSQPAGAPPSNRSRHVGRVPRVYTRPLRRSGATPPPSAVGACTPSPGSRAGEQNHRTVGSRPAYQAA